LESFGGRKFSGAQVASSFLIALILSLIPSSEVLRS